MARDHEFDMKIVIANWKLNPKTEQEARRLVGVTHDMSKKIRSVKTVVCPPYIWIPALRSLVRKPLELGAQNGFWKDTGAFTGEVSFAMLKEAHCRWVIIGHSERRIIFKETDELINQKVKAALKAGFQVVLAVGERDRNNDPDSVSAVLEQQVEKALEGVPKEHIKRVVIAYEPVWAIGTGNPETPEGALKAALLIKKVVGRVYGNGFAEKLHVLYGGSVTDQNVASFVKQDGIDGVLVGGASVDGKIFPKLLAALK